MGLFIKVITIEDVIKELHPSTFGALELYPNGTKRVIKKLTLKGWKTYNQITSIESDTDGDSYYYYNKWENVVITNLEH